MTDNTTALNCTSIETYSITIAEVTSTTTLATTTSAAATCTVVLTIISTLDLATTPPTIPGMYGQLTLHVQ